MMLPLFVLLCFVSSTASELVYVHVLYRHGDRAPIGIYPKDPYQASAWPNGLGQLTTQGKQETFELGRFLRERYGIFLSPVYNHSEIYIRSSDIDRALMTAEGVLSGLYLPSSVKQQFNPKLRWNPVPIHTVPADEDILLLDANCARIDTLMKEIFESAVVQSINQKYAALFTKISSYTGIKDFSFTNVGRLWDTLFCESCNNISSPSWVTPNVNRTLKALDDKGWQLDYYNLELRRLRGGFLLNEVLDHLMTLSNLSKGAQPPSSKMMMYSAHDTTVSAFMAAAGIFNGVQPPYTSVVMTELHKEDGRFFVRLLFHNSTDPPHRMTVPRCKYSCPVSELAELWAKTLLTPSSRKTQCANSGPSRHSVVRVLAFVLAGASVAGLIGAVGCVVVHLLGRRRYRRYRTLGHTAPEDMEVNGDR